MDWILYTGLFVFGLIIGSFLNVVILRFNTGMSAMKGRSACFSCGKTLHWYELVPLASFLVQKGACRGCKARISWQYPLVELAGGLAFVLAYMIAPEICGLWAILFCLYIVIAVYDIRHKIIPDFFSYSAAVVALAIMGVNFAMADKADYWQVIAGPLMFGFFWAFWKASKGTWMGLGDGKLALSMGWALGLSMGLAARLLSFWIGAVVSLVVMAIQRLIHGKTRLGLHSQIPFGPFLLVGFFIVLIGRLDVWALLSHLAL